MTIARNTLLKRLLILPPLIVGVVFVVIAVQGRNGPERAPAAEQARKVRVIEAPRLAVIPRALAFGNVSPGKVWSAVAEVSGKVVEIHPQLKNGAILPKGTVLLRLEASDYQLAINGIAADIRGARARLAQLSVRAANLRASLAIENRGIELDTREVGRKKRLARTRAVSQAAVDQEERNLLARRQSVQTLINEINLIPTERQSLSAQIAAYGARLADAKLDLARTTITLPFDARIAKVNVERTQYAAAGQVLATADSIDVSEVSAQLPIDKLLRLISPDNRDDIDPATVMADFQNALGLIPIVRLRSGDFVSTWQGRVARVSDTIDPRTRTVGIIVAVDAPYRQSGKKFRPPLAKNMFVEVELRGRRQADQIVIPRPALHGRRVYVVNAENRLEIRDIRIRFVQGDFAVIASGLAAAETVVISDLFPAIEGMLLAPEIDLDAARALARDAAGEGALR